MKRLIPAIMMVASVLIAQPPQQKIPPEPTVRRLSEQEKREAMKFIREYGGSARLRRLEDFRMNAPLEYERHLKSALIKKRDMERLRKMDPKLYNKRLGIMKLERESFDLAEEYRKVENEQERRKIKEQLRTILSEQFDLKEEEKSARIKKLEDEIARLKEELAKRKKNKEEIINMRLKDLLGESRYLEW